MALQLSPLNRWTMIPSVVASLGSTGRSKPASWLRCAVPEHLSRDSRSSWPIFLTQHSHRVHLIRRSPQRCTHEAEPSDRRNVNLNKCNCNSYASSPANAIRWSKDICTNEYLQAPVSHDKTLAQRHKHSDPFDRVDGTMSVQQHNQPHDARERSANCKLSSEPGSRLCTSTSPSPPQQKRSEEENTGCDANAQVHAKGFLVRGTAA